MSNSPSAAVRTLADVLPDFVLTTPPLTVLPVVEEELNRRFELRYIDIRVRSKEMTFDDAAEKAAETISVTRPFVPYSAGFDRAVCVDKSLTGLLLWACLQRHHRQFTLPQAEELLVTHDDRYFEIRSAVLDLLGYRSRKKSDAVADQAQEAATEST